MRRVFTIFLMAAMMCAPNCESSNASDGQEPTHTFVKNEKSAVTADNAEIEVWNTDYMTIMRKCCLTGDISAGREAEAERNAKIDALSLDVQKISFDELNELAKVITNEAGSFWIPTDWKMMVGEVVLNRTASVEYPDTITEVIHQEGQYANTNTRYFENLLPYDDCVEVAYRLLNGERVINDGSVVFQAGHRQGSGTYLELYDKYNGYTYLCYSNSPELYTTKE